MSDITVKTAEEAEQKLHSASCIILTLDQLISQVQFEEPVCAAALSETLSIANEKIQEVMNYLNLLSIAEHRKAEAQRA